jgi:hypothetical protein
MQTQPPQTTRNSGASPQRDPEHLRQQRRHTQRTSTAENFIPIRKADLQHALLRSSSLSDAEHRSLQQLFNLLEAAIHYEYHQRLELLKNAYAPFDPDSDVPGEPQRAVALPPELREQTAQEFFGALKDLLDRANFQHLSHEHLTQALDEKSRMGINMDVDFSIFQALEIYARGDRKVVKWLPATWFRWKKLKCEVPIYQRLVVLFRLKPNPAEPAARTEQIIYAKLFKDIPKTDIDMLLPGTRVQMSLLDQSKIILPTISGLVYATYKIISGALMIAFMNVTALLSVLGIIGGTVGYGFKSFYSYLNTKDKYFLNLTRNLYYQNLDTNGGVLFRLLDEAEEQEFREIMIAYYVLWKQGDIAGWTVEQIDVAAEELILKLTGVPVDFEIGDALEKLASLKLIVPAANRKWRAISLEAAIAALDATWDALFSMQSAAPASSVPHFFRPANTQLSAEDAH